MIRDEYKQFLLGPASAGKTRHSGRMLYDHLCGTHDLLQEWGNSEPVCAAGLFHSIYGTKHFRHQSWPLEDRATIRALIGPEAELLAFMFCTMDRKEFLTLDQPSAVQDGISTPYAAPSLREIEAANLIEQGGRPKRLKELCEAGISDAAKRAVERYLRPAEAADAA
jgi:hypothetical protein